MSNQSHPKSPSGIAVITGASAGIGKIYADRLARRGHDVVLVARRKDRLEALAQELTQKYGVEATPLVADLGNADDLKRVAEILATNERITLLVNNAGLAHLKPSTELSVSEAEQLMAVNAAAVTHLSQAVLPAFVKRNRGTIVNIGSVLSFYALPISTTYSATKAHVMLFTLGLQEELAGTAVRVQLVLPASTDTEIWDLAGVGVHNLDSATVMSAEDCVDAALAGLDSGEAVTLPSVEDPGLWAAFNEARIRMFQASQTGKAASRYGIPNKTAAASDPRNR